MADSREVAEAFVEGLKAAVRMARTSVRLREITLNEHDRAVVEHALEQHAQDVEKIAALFQRKAKENSQSIRH